MKRLVTMACVGALALASLAAPPRVPSPTGLQVPAADRRGGEQTYLTFPEWFLVFSPAEYADWLQHHAPTRFPFFRHVGQFWSAYGHVIAATRHQHFNAGYHVMICVIGASTTIEYSIKGAYDTLIGRLSQLGLPPNATPEDRLAASVEQDYVRFIRVEPWYKFDFATPLKRLWADTPWWGAYPLREWERRYALTTEWSVKAAYGWLLGKATHEAYAAPKPTTIVVVRNLPNANLPADVERLRHAGDEDLVALPRYQAFTAASSALAQRGTKFVDIAGNRGTILVSIVAPTSMPAPRDAPVLFMEPIITRPGYRRLVLQVPVTRLSAVLNRYAPIPGAIEHVFDY